MFNPLREFFVPKYVVGLQVTGHFIGAVQIYNSLRGPEINRVAFRELESQDQIEDELIDLFRAGNLRHEMLITCIPTSLAMFRQLSLSFDKVKKLDKIIKYQMEPHVPYPIEHMIVDFLPPGPDGKIMTFGIQKASLAAHMESLSGFNLAPRVVTLDDLALLSLCVRRNSAGPEYPVCIFHMGVERNVMQVISKKSLEFIRILPGGSDGFEALEKTIRLYQMDNPDILPEEILLTGYPGVDQEMEDRIATFTRIKTTTWKPFDEHKHRLGHIEPELQAKLGVPLGLALSIAGPSGKLFNLRKEEFVSRNIVDLKKTFLFMITAIFLFIILFTFNLYQGLYIQENRYGELKRDIREVFAKAFPETKTIVKGRELDQMSQMIEEEAVKYQWLEGLTGEGAVLNVLITLSRTISSFPGVMVDNLSIEQRDIKLHGRAASFKTVDRLKRHLSNTGIFKTIKLVGAKMDRKKKAVRFSFAMEKKQ